MAPKKKGKKKSPAELEAERLALEEQMRLEEEERKRIEEEERLRLEAEEAERQRLKKEHLDAEGEVLSKELAELAPMYADHKQKLADAEQRRLEARDWEHFLECTPLPDAMDPRALRGFLDRMWAVQDPSLQSALEGCEDILSVLLQCEDVKTMAQQLKQSEYEAEMQKTLTELQKVICYRLDSSTAHLLQHSDMYAVDTGEPSNVQVTAHTPCFKAGVWVNTSKNPRLKSKQVDDLFEKCTNEYAAVGGLLIADLLVLPPPCRKVKDWTLRQVTPLSKTVQRLPYPIPPAGRGPQHTKGWSEEGITDVEHDRERGKLSFHTTKLAPLAIIQSRVRLMPYMSWHTRPCAGEQGGEAILSLEVGLDEPVEFHVTERRVKLLGPKFPCFEDLRKQWFTPRRLLLELGKRGMFLTPEDRDAEFAKVSPKKLEVEEAMCKDAALLGDSFLLASCKWNQFVAEDECIMRLHEILDWEAGGRTEARHVHRIFSKEKEEGPRK
eukprot:jgi/Tetstr1/420372/TSEL_011490.t1